MTLEQYVRLELTLPAWKAEIIPIYEYCLVRLERIALSQPSPKLGVLLLYYNLLVRNQGLAP